MMKTAPEATTMNHDSHEGDTVRDGRSSGSTQRGGLGWRHIDAALATVVAILVIVLSTSSALANWSVHKNFGGEDLHTPIGVAVDESGDIYVANEGGESLNDEFNYEDDLLNPPSPFGPGGGKDFSGVTANPTNHHVYVVRMLKPPAVYAVNLETGAQQSFELPAADYPFKVAEITIASDRHGNVYVPEVLANRIAIFNEEGNAPIDVASEIAGLSKPEGVAIGPGGIVWVADTGAGKIEAFEPTEVGGQPAFALVSAKTIEVANVQAVAVDSSGDVFASVGGKNVTPRVVEYNAKGVAINGAEKIAEGLLTQGKYYQPDGIAFDRAREYLYVADGGGNVIQRFINWSVATGEVTKLGKGQATLHGTLEVGAGSSVGNACTFEYGLTTTYGNTAPCEQAGPYMGTVPVSATVSGLIPGAHYHYRLSATGNAGGVTQVGADRAFGGPPQVMSEAAEVIVTTGTARAQVKVTEESQSTCEIQYVEEAEYKATGFEHADSIRCSAPITAALGEYRVETDEIKNLVPDRIYEYRFVTETADHTFTLNGPDEEFATFGVAAFAFGAVGLPPAFSPVTDAGAHPYAWTDTFRLNTSTNNQGDTLATDANPKDIITELPAGLVGNPDATPKCSPYNVAHADCSGATQVGMIKIDTANPGSVEKHGMPYTSEEPLYNLVPPEGIAAQFGARFNGFVTIHIDARVRTGDDYGVAAEVINGSTGEGVVGAEVTLWGVPAEAGHDEQRYCPVANAINEEHLGEGPFSTEPCAERGPLIPFLTNPTACTGEREARMTVEPWQETQQWREHEPPPTVAKMPAITGCGALKFTPSFKITPTETRTDSPTGLEVHLHLPQNENPEELAEADLKDVTVALPEGMTVNPASANGMVGCTPEEVGYLAQKSAEVGHPQFTPEAAQCPENSKVGTVKIQTPLLEEELTGGVYVAQQTANPFKSLVALYIAAEAPERGVVVKLPGHVELNEKTGQITTTFDENPQLPFENLTLKFFKGPRAALANPTVCDGYRPTTSLTSWAAPTKEVKPSIEPMEIETGPNGGECAPLGFGPGFSAGTKENQAGSFGAFTMTLTRKDGEQRFGSVSLAMPDGLAGMLSKVTLCPNAQAEAGDCPASSKIGHVVVNAGVGGEPITLPEPGKAEDPVYITEKYEGAPFGLSIVVPAEAGPFNLGTVVVRSKIEINPATAQVSVVSNPLPTILQGVPLDVQAIHVDVNKPGFMFNPTSCEPMAVNGTIGSAEGASANVSSRFQAANCASLKFKPTFAAEIHAHHTRRDGEYMHVTIKSGFGQASVAKVHVVLPEKLPSELKTLQQACTAAQFAENPAGCPEGSFVGHAIAHTPVLPVPLQGPAIFVSHGGTGFPNLDLVLQGDGVHITLVGDTHISNSKITTSTFESVPDVPVSLFELTLPSGPHPALAGNGNMCLHPMYMPVTITGHNGAVVEHRTRIKVKGCKPQLHVISHHVSGDHAKLVVRVPSAGKLVVNGKGVARAVKRAGKAKPVTVMVHLTGHVRKELAKHRNRRLTVRLGLKFKMRSGKVLHAHVTVLMR